MSGFFSYLKARTAERDSQVVMVSALYTIVRGMVPLEYQMIVDTVAGAVGAAYFGTPIKKLVK